MWARVVFTLFFAAAFRFGGVCHRLGYLEVPMGSTAAAYSVGSQNKTKAEIRRQQAKRDRVDAMGRASRYRAKGKIRKAIKEYRALLEADPNDHEVHAKIAPLLAKRKLHAEAWVSFSSAGATYVREGFHERALATFSQATECLPYEPRAWCAVANIKAQRGMRIEAVDVLLRGSKHFKKKKDLEDALQLLSQASQLVPWHVAATCAYAKKLAQSGDKKRALATLQPLISHATPKQRRTVYRCQFGIRPTPGNLWRVIRA